MGLGLVCVAGRGSPDPPQTGDNEWRNHRRDIIRFKMRRKSELFSSLLANTHEASLEFRFEYSRALLAQVKARFLMVIPEELERDPASNKLSKSLDMRGGVDSNLPSCLSPHLGQLK
jgi:hypothetical protein